MKNNKSKFKSSGSNQQGQLFDKKFINDDFIIDVPIKDKLNSECLYAVILLAEIPTEFYQAFLPQPLKF